MKQVCRKAGWRMLVAVGVLSLFGTPVLHAAPKKASGKPDFRVTFKTSVSATDPFSDLNATNLPPGAKNEVRRGETILLTIEGTLQKGWHTYPINKRAPGRDDGTPSKLTVTTPQYVADLWPVVESEPKLFEDKKKDEQYNEFDGPFTWTLELLVRPDAPAGQTVNVEIAIDLVACTETCEMEHHTLSVPITISPSDPDPLSPDIARRLKEYDAAARTRAVADKAAPPSAESVSNPSSPSGSSDWNELQIVDKTEGSSSRGNGFNGLWGTVITAVLGGFIALLTPCVFPMIPVTVSFFLHQAETKRHSAIVMASVYCGTIVVVLTVGGMALVSVLQTISQHWITNVFLTVVFIFFALSLLGMYEITLPSGLANLTSAREGKGGLAGIMFMALTFSIISFACVGPIYGGFIAIDTASQQSAVAGWLQRFMGPFAFAVAFTFPFFFLALFPTLLKSMPKSGSWMNSVKVVMGFLELAAAFKFVRAAELNFFHKTNFFSFDLTLGIYVTLALACGLYLLGLYRLPHDHGAPESIGVMRLVFSLVFIALAFYLVPGMFKDDKGRTQNPRGDVFAWVQAFLLPEDEPSTNWQTDLGTALARAEREKKPLFLDFTGQTCPNCKLNERRVFSQPQIEELFKRYVLVRLYTDTVPAGVTQVPDAANSAKFRDTKFENYALPYYVILQPKGKTLEKVFAYEKGVISDTDEFAALLKKYAEPQVR